MQALPWVISVDDHVVEPPHVWQRWLPSRLRDRGPRVVQDSCEQDYSDHMAIAGSRRAAYMVLNALDPERPVKVPCTFVPPFTG